MAGTLPDPETMTPAELVAEVTKMRCERIRLQRQVRALQAGNAWLEKASELFADVTMRSDGIVDAIHQARRRYLPYRLHQAPLCAIERCLHRQGIAVSIILIVYELVTPAIVRQIDQETAARRDDAEAQARAEKAPPLIYGTPPAWPGRQPKGGPA